MVTTHEYTTRVPVARAKSTSCVSYPIYYDRGCGLQWLPHECDSRVPATNVKPASCVLHPVFYDIWIVDVVTAVHHESACSKGKNSFVCFISDHMAFGAWMRLPHECTTRVPVARAKPASCV